MPTIGTIILVFLILAAILTAVTYLMHKAKQPPKKPLQNSVAYKPTQKAIDSQPLVQEEPKINQEVQDTPTPVVGDFADKTDSKNSEDFVISITSEEIQAYYEEREKAGKFTELSSYEEYKSGEHRDIAFYYRGSLFQVQLIPAKKQTKSGEEVVDVPFFLIDGNIVDESKFDHVLEELRTDGNTRHSLIKLMKGTINPYNQRRRTFLHRSEAVRMAGVLDVELDEVFALTKDHRFFLEEFSIKGTNYKVISLPSDKNGNWKYHYLIFNSLFEEDEFISEVDKHKKDILKALFVDKRYKYTPDEEQQIIKQAREYYKDKRDTGALPRSEANLRYSEFKTALQDMQYDPRFSIKEVEIFGVHLSKISKRADVRNEDEWIEVYYVNNEEVDKTVFDTVCLDLFNEVPSDFD